MSYEPNRGEAEEEHSVDENIPDLIDAAVDLDRPLDRSRKCPVPILGLGHSTSPTPELIDCGYVLISPANKPITHG